MTPTLTTVARVARRPLLAALAVALGAIDGGAQSISAAKKAANNAAAKTNERLEKQTGQPPAAKAPTGAAKSPTGAAKSPTGAATQRPGAQPGRAAVAERAVQDELSLEREVFSYAQVGRDPFLSLITSGDLRPLLTDLKVVAIIYDPSGRNSVAVMRDISTKDQYRVKRGQMVGRMRVRDIRPREVVFTIEEFGFSRQESLALIDTTKVRSP